MKISLIQMNMKAGDTEYNFCHAKELLIEAAQESPDVIVLPETWNTGFFPKENLSELCDCNAIRTKALLEEISKNYGVAIVGGSVVENKEGKIFNTCYVYNEQGKEIAFYSKTHLFSPMDEDKYFEKGNSLCVFSIKGVKCAVCICYDVRFPELIRKLALEDIKVLFVPMQWPDNRITQMEILTKARAVENQMFTVACNSCGSFGGTVFGGNSVICSPAGENILKTGCTEEIKTAGIDFTVSEELKNFMDVFKDRREDIY